MIFTLPCTVDAHDVDYHGIARASCLDRYAQMAANYHLRSTGVSNEALRKEGRAFILSRISMYIYKEVHSYDELKAQTFTCPPRGYSHIRCYRLLRGDELVAEASSYWALIDIESRRLLRTSEYTYPCEHEPPLNIACPARLDIKPTEEMTLLGHHLVSYAEADMNRHMNNTCYPDMLTTFLNMDGRRVSEMHIHFLAEAPLGEMLSIYAEEAEDGTRFRSVRESDGRTNVEALFRFTPITGA